MKRLTKREKNAVLSAVGLALAGVDPWEDDGTFEQLISAQAKLQAAWIDTSEIPEADEAWFARAKLKQPTEK